LVFFYASSCERGLFDLLFVGFALYILILLGFVFAVQILDGSFSLVSLIHGLTMPPINIY
jgi:hypothetical protein